MSNEKFYEAVFRDELPMSREYASKGWPPLLYPWFLAIVQLPDSDLPARRAFTLHLGDCIRSGVLPAVRQRIPWFIEKDVFEPHISAQDFCNWLAFEGRSPSLLVGEWFKSQGVGNTPIAESKKERNARWLAVKDEAKRTGPETGAQARAVSLIAKNEGVTESLAKRGIQDAEKARKEAHRAGGIHATRVEEISAHNVFAPVKSKGRTSR